MASSQSAKRSQNSQELASHHAKRPRPSPDDQAAGLPRQKNHYTVGWVCALSIEMAAAEAMLDMIHQPLPHEPDDGNSYTLGQVGPHNIAIACLPKGHYGTNNAAIVASNMRRSFPSINLWLMVGIGGGIPGSVDLRLGDVIIGEQVIQYDLGKATSGGQFERTGLFTRPPPSLMTKVSRHQSWHFREPCRIPSLLSDMVHRHPKMADFTRPDHHPDRLFPTTYTHDPSNENCERCDRAKIIERPNRCDNHPKIFYGKIASANTVVKDSAVRDKLAKELGIICFEMEAAGLIDNFPCLVVRGICDYADSHKEKDWQKYAAATSAAYAKDFLLEVPETQLYSLAVEYSPSSAESKQAVDRRQLILESLDFEHRETRHRSVRLAFSKSCQWFPTHTNYVRWLDSKELPNHHGFLWLDGKPGAGKSTLMKYAFNAAKKSSDSNPLADSAVVAFFFNARGDTLEKSTEGMYRSLLLQIFDRFPDLQEVVDRYISMTSRQPDTASNWDLQTLQSILCDITEKLGDKSLTFFIDALDECNDDQVLAMVEYFEELGERAFQNGNRRLYICFSSRPYPHIGINKGIRFTLERQEEHGEDLKKYIYGKLKAGEGKAVDEVRTKILTKSAGVFLWIVLVIDILNEEFRHGRIFAVEKRLQELPPKLGDLFKDILCRDQRNMDDLLLCIQWILFAKRPLRCEEYYFALSTGLLPAGEAPTEWDSEFTTDEYMQRFVLSSSKGLAEVTRSKNIVQFIHESVRDYLIKEKGIYGLWPDLAEDFEGQSHDRLKRCCYDYATNKIPELDSVLKPLPKASSDNAKNIRHQATRRFPLLEYATHHVFYHAEKAASWRSQLEFLKRLPFPTLLNRFNMLQQYETCRLEPDSSIAYFLAGMNYPVLLEVVMYNQDTSCIPAGEYESIIILTCHRGYFDVLKILLELAKADVVSRAHGRRSPRNGSALRAAPGRGPDANAQGGYLGRALQAASGQGHKEIVQLLLDRGADINARDRYNGSALQAASGYGHRDIVQLLLDRGADTNAQGGDALEAASKKGHREIVQLLLDRGPDINTWDRHGGDALVVASREDHREIVQLLLDRGADVNTQYAYSGTTALQDASEKGYREIVQLLLERGADVNTEYGYFGESALQAASGQGHREIVQLLLDWGANIKAQRGRSALRAASGHGHREIVQLLLDRGARYDH